MKDGSAYVPPIRTQPIKMMTYGHRIKVLFNQHYMEKGNYT